MADAAAKVGDGKSSWQRFVGGVVDMVQRSKWIDGLNKYKAAQAMAKRGSAPKL